MNCSFILEYTTWGTSVFSEIILLQWRPQCCTCTMWLHSPGHQRVEVVGSWTHRVKKNWNLDSKVFDLTSWAGKTHKHGRWGSHFGLAIFCHEYRKHHQDGKKREAEFKTSREELICGFREREGDLSLGTNIVPVFSLFDTNCFSCPKSILDIPISLYTPPPLFWPSYFGWISALADLKRYCAHQL